ncbi:MAG TPA: outer membrane beta-barrel protein, partial [Chitinophagaceae bacterium]|nr:outer membrane beta-barrel protein [Chitinophagaceae bacterium]
GYSLSTDVGFKIQPVDISVEIDMTVTGSHAYSYINHVLSTSNTNTYWASVQLQKNVQKKYYFSVVAAPNYTVNEFSLSGQRNNNAAGFYGELTADWHLPCKFEVASAMHYSYTAATQTLTAQNRAIWDASLSKAFFKNENLRLSLAANDLLNQNINFTRNVTANAITQNSFNSIRRYFMLSLTWDFTRFGTQPAKK